LQFAGIEIGVSNAVGDDAGEIVVRDKISDPSVDFWIDHFPISGVQQTYYVRQLEFIDGAEVAGRWSEAPVTPEFFPYFFLKDVEEPETLFVKFEPLRGLLPSRKLNAPVEAVSLWGVAKPVHKTGEERHQSGEVTIELYGGDPNVPLSADEQLSAFHRLALKHSTMAILSHKPAARYYVQMMGEASEDITQTIDYEVSFAWEETRYEEGYYDREDS
jgi:hypothetical protein